jgi:hypothetical protein
MGIMAKYRESLHLLLKSKGVDDVMSTDFKDIDLNTTASQISVRYVLGNIPLMLGKYKTPKEVDKVVEDFLSQPLPNTI